MSLTVNAKLISLVCGTAATFLAMSLFCRPSRSFPSRRRAEGEGHAVEDGPAVVSVSEVADLERRGHHPTSLLLLTSR